MILTVPALFKNQEVSLGGRIMAQEPLSPQQLRRHLKPRPALKEPGVQVTFEPPVRPPKAGTRVFPALVGVQSAQNPQTNLAGAGNDIPNLVIQAQNDFP
jgi:hypothetical protein